MSDLIDRQEVIDALDIVINKGIKNKYFNVHLLTAEAMKEYILARPSAQQEIIRCIDCKYYEGVHNIQGHAPCTYWKSGGVLWNWFCSQAERWEDE